MASAADVAPSGEAGVFCVPVTPRGIELSFLPVGEAVAVARSGERCGWQFCIGIHTVVARKASGGFLVRTYGQPPAEVVNDVRRRIEAGEKVVPEPPQRRREKPTKCQRGHLLEGDNVVVEASGKRRCRICRDAYNDSRPGRGGATRQAERAASVAAGESSGAGASGSTPTAAERDTPDQTHGYWKPKRACPVRSKTRRRQFRRHRRKG